MVDDRPALARPEVGMLAQGEFDVERDVSPPGGIEVAGNGSPRIGTIKEQHGGSRAAVRE